MATVRESSTCFCLICNTVRETIRQTFYVIDKYGWLLDAYIVDFYEDNLWSKLPRSWINFFDNTSPRELGSWILNENSSNRVWPLSLLALRRVIGLLQINRDPRSDISLKCENTKTSTTEPLRPFKTPNDDEPSNGESSSCSNHPKLQNLFGKNVKPKKKHEIDVMAKIIADCAKSTKSECASDVGAGMGHLARTLAYKYNMCVTCVEQQTQLSEQARKLDAHFEAMALKYLPNFSGQKPQHVSLKIEKDSSGSSLFVERLNREFKEKFRLDPELSGFGLIGLHPCGDLATTLLQCYAESECAKFICVAGCCYMKLTLGDASEPLRSYPLSEYLRSSKSNKLSYAALEVACHAIESHCEKLKSSDYGDLKIHAYRAALETLLIQKNPFLRHGPVKSVKLKENTTFQESVIELHLSLRN